MSRASRLYSCPQRCGGGLVKDRAPFPFPKGRPRFTCTKCGHSFTAGIDAITPEVVEVLRYDGLLLVADDPTGWAENSSLPVILRDAHAKLRSQADALAAERAGRERAEAALSDLVTHSIALWANVLLVSQKDVRFGHAINRARAALARTTEEAR